jgi:hypothetical protein
MQETNDQKRILELDLTSVGHFNDLFFGVKEKHFVSSAKLFDFITQKKGSLNITTILLRGSGEPMFHPDFKKIVRFIQKENIGLNIFTFPYLLSDYQKILGESFSLVDFSFYVYPNSDYAKDWTFHSSFLNGENQSLFNQIRKPSLFYLLNEKTRDCLDDFIWETSKRGLTFNILRPMEKESIVSSGLLSKAKSRFKKNNIHLNIQWEDGKNPNCLCSYFRDQRIFMNCDSQFSVCHFLPFSDKYTFSPLEIKENNSAASNFYSLIKEKREEERKKYFMNKKYFCSPCDICLKVCSK